MEVVKDFLGQDIRVGTVVVGSDGKGASLIFGEVISIHGDKDYPVVDIELLMSGGNFDKSWKMKKGTKKNLKVIKKIKEFCYNNGIRGEVENEFPYILALSDEQAEFVKEKIKREFIPKFKKYENK